MQFQTLSHEVKGEGQVEAALETGGKLVLIDGRFPFATNFAHGEHKGAIVLVRPIDAWHRVLDLASEHDAFHDGIELAWDIVRNEYAPLEYDDDPPDRFDHGYWPSGAFSPPRLTNAQAGESANLAEKIEALIAQAWQEADLRGSTFAREEAIAEYFKDQVAVQWAEAFVLMNYFE